MSGINSTDPEYEDLQKTVECAREMTRIFDDMTGRLRMERAELLVLSEELAGSGGRGGASRGAPVPSTASARAFPELEQSLARRTAGEKELVNAAAAFGQLLVRWAQALEKQAEHRKLQKGSAPSATVSVLVVKAHSPLIDEKYDPASKSPPSDESQSIGQAMGMIFHSVGSQIYGVLESIFHRQYDPVPDNKEGILELYGDAMQTARDVDPTTATGLGRAVVGVGMAAASEAVAEGTFPGDSKPATTDAAKIIETVPSKSESLTSSGGRLGSTATRAQLANFGEQLQSQGFTITGGGSIEKEEWIPGPGGRLKGGTFVDLTASHGSITIRVQTVDTLSDGVTLTLSETAAAVRIQTTFPNHILIVIPKPSKPY